ncbi:hypothetical protein [Streptomyces sp. NBC_01233]|uniref:hypothetical protein n=1 Tax=Streptomyces sp. NBC_01233 TaxID=2903787 RepID=UPI002E0DBA3B|nr:hypothetical protein OG332_14115 [Streptomyces sp. NBC_01233]
MTHERPELTVIPVDAFRAKGAELAQPSYSSHEATVNRAMEQAENACLADMAIPEQVVKQMSPIMDAVKADYGLGKDSEMPSWDSPELCVLWAGHRGKHVSHFSYSYDNEHGRGALWMIWGQRGSPVVRQMPFCGHSACNHPRDFYCLGCNLPIGHEGRHSGRG